MSLDLTHSSVRIMTDSLFGRCAVLCFLKNHGLACNPTKAELYEAGGALPRISWPHQINVGAIWTIMLHHGVEGMARRLTFASDGPLPYIWNLSFGVAEPHRSLAHINMSSTSLDPLLALHVTLLSKFKISTRFVQQTVYHRK